LKFKLKEKCETCNSCSGLTRSHFVKESSVHKTKSKFYDYESPENWFTQCLQCHVNYERYPIRHKKNLYNLENMNRFKNSLITRQSYLIKKHLYEYAERIDYLINE
jgi:hypothetical protein